MVMPTTGSIVGVVNNTEGLYEGNLRPYLQVLFTKAENREAGYHNLRHMLHVTLMCYMALFYYKGSGVPINLRRARNLMVAAIFHDFNHAGKRVHSDGINIARAIMAFHEHCTLEDRKAYGEIVELIGWTEYPYNSFIEDQVDLLGHILRDADRSQAMSTAWIQQVAIGLARELELTPLEMLKGQVQFLENLKFDSQWGKFMFPPEAIEAKKTETQGLIEILQSPLL
jgi:hypothetical protein